MPRYIDADKMLEFIKETNANYHWLLNQYNASWIYDFIESQPTADVVPMAEVDELKKERDEYKKHVDEDIIYVHRIKSEVASDILREVRQALLHMILANSMGETYDIEKRFSEIEKKYEVKKDG